MALACVGETAVNAMLFAQVSSWGAAGGAAYSLALSLAQPGAGLYRPASWACAASPMSARPCAGSPASSPSPPSPPAPLWNFYVGHLRALAERLARIASRCRSRNGTTSRPDPRPIPPPCSARRRPSS